MRKKLSKPEKVEGWHLHHIFFGNANRKLSDKWGCVIYLPPEMHNLSGKGVHFNREFDLMLKRECQQRLEAAGWTREEFVETFGRNYLD